MARGTRAFSPGCVVVGSSRAVHVLANSDDAVPPGFPTNRLYGITWNPLKLMASLTAIEGVTNARRVGVDGMTPSMYALLHDALPDASFVDAGPLLAELVRVKTDADVAGLRAASALVSHGLRAMALALRPGVFPRHLRGVFASRMASEGVTTPAFEAVAVPLAGGAPSWLPPERTLGVGEPVGLRAGVLYNGYEASVARTYVCRERSARVAYAPEVEPAPKGWHEFVAACRPGVAIGALRARAGAVVHGSGFGYEALDDDVPLEPGMCLAIELRTYDRLQQDMLLVGSEAPELLT